MIRNRYTLELLIKEFSFLIGKKLLSAFTQEKDVLVFEFFDGNKFDYLFASLDSKNCSIFIKENFSRAKKNVYDVFKSNWGHFLQNIELAGGERIIKLDFGDFSIYLSLFGGSKSGIFLVSDSIINDSFKSPKTFIGQDFTISPSLDLNFYEFEPDEKLTKSLSNDCSRLGAIYSKEILDRLKIDPRYIVSDLSIIEIEAIKYAKDELIQELRNSKNYYVYFDEDFKIQLSLIKLNRIKQILYEGDSISKSIQKRIALEAQNKEFHNRRSRALAELIKRKEKLERAVEMAVQETKSLERASQYQFWAETLISQPNAKEKGLEIINIDFDDEIISIPLKDNLSLAENANRYFEKAKDSRTSYKNRLLIAEKTKKTLPQIIEKINKIQKANNIKELELVLAMEENKQKNKNSNSQDDKFRKFELEDGAILYVGKNAQNNDELTMKFAKPNDWWMHARGVGGSHAILRYSGSNKPPKKLMEKAAQIVAFYSQAKHSKYAPVCYTQKKYVSKPKGANPGSVVISREEVVMAEPKIPEEFKNIADE